MVQTICAHCVAYSQLRQLALEAKSSAAANCVNSASLEAFCSAVKTELSLWGRLIDFPISNEAERHDKAAYMLGLR
ncbi:hypothetical protein [Mesorhizobium sp. M0243]|uniref:hypothetical protein n=1 Tax=Mesorhizobium sp. M0243 TaxID=2956925 RepID=UPI003337AA9A